MKKEKEKERKKEREKKESKERKNLVDASWIRNEKYSLGKDDTVD